MKAINSLFTSISSALKLNWSRKSGSAAELNESDFSGTTNPIELWQQFNTSVRDPRLTEKDNKKIADKIETSFEELLGKVTKKRSSITTSSFNLDAFDFPSVVQAKAFDFIFGRRNVLLNSPTGTGKTLSYLLPVLCKIALRKKKTSIACVIIVPTRELVSQLLLDIDLLLKDTKLGTQIKIKSSQGFLDSDTEVSLSDCHVFVTTPRFLINTLSNDRKIINKKSLQYLVFDEGDLLFDVSHKNSFIRQMTTIYNNLLGNCKEGRKQFSCVLSTATLHKSIVEWADSYLADPVKIEVSFKKGHQNKLISQEFVYTSDSHEGKIIELEKIFAQDAFPCIVFVNSRKELGFVKERLAKEFGKLKIASFDDRDESIDRLQSFTSKEENEGYQVLICTDLLSRGIDFDNVRTIIHYDFPPSLSSYIHRNGRANRRCTLKTGVRNTSSAYIFYNEKDLFVLSTFRSYLKEYGIAVPGFLIQAMKSKKLLNKVKYKSYARNKNQTKNQHKNQHKKSNGRKRESFRTSFD